MSGDALFHLSRVRKTYGLRRVPTELFPECRLAPGLQPRSADWRATCGRYEECRRDCPRCWALSIDELSIGRGRTTAILGHSGSGKTSLLYLLALLHLPDSDCGRCETSFGEGLSFSFRDGRWQDSNGGGTRLDEIRRRRFGFIFQAGYLSSHLTAEQNVGLALALTGEPAEIIRRRSRELLARVEFPSDRYHALPRHLSGGEYQRVAVARALAADPEVLFADEPTGNLDPVTGRRVIELLTAWRQEGAARSLILVTHNLQHAFASADDLLVLNGGEVLLAGPSSDLSREQVEEALHRKVRR